MIRVSETAVKLNMPITIGRKDGTFDEVYEITIKGPTAGKSQRAAAAALQAMFEKPFNEEIERSKDTPEYKAAQEKKKSEPVKAGSDSDKSMRDFFDPSMVLRTISAYRDSSVAERDAITVALNYLESLLTTGCGVVDGSPMGTTDFAKISYSDMKVILGEYVANFLLDSLFD